MAFEDAAGRVMVGYVAPATLKSRHALTRVDGELAAMTKRSKVSSPPPPPPPTDGIRAPQSTADRELTGRLYWIVLSSVSEICAPSATNRSMVVLAVGVQVA